MSFLFRITAMLRERPSGDRWSATNGWYYVLVYSPVQGLLGYRHPSGVVNWGISGD